jgi:hypothetical protein
VDVEAGRAAAYSDLVAAVLDLRSPEATRAFDAALSAAVATGVLPEEIARQLRWLQRQSERAVIEHAETVLPPALVALQRSITPPGPCSTESLAEPLGEPRPEHGQQTPAQPAAPEEAADRADLGELGDVDEVEESEPAPVVQLQARRMLVAGLRPLPDPAHRGTLPS